MESDKLIQVGSQVDETSYKFSREIKDKKKIAEFENWFDEIIFTEGLDEMNGYADIIVLIRHDNDGTFTNPISVWFDEDESTVANGIGSEGRTGKLSSSQLKDLRNIIDLK
ncbi:hypothetical protein [Carnobacterium sp. TMP28]|uniref:hypothetical protein n=1 Tax=Carnobacterium sp. TMP28 TaxID=3397060 RepID=UPI0039E1E877